MIVRNAAALAMALLIADQVSAKACDWTHPGARQFSGDVVAAVNAYQDIPAAIRAALQQRMARRQYDDIVTITRDRVEGRSSYNPQIRDMHWASGLCKGPVSRARWLDDMQERGLVYCEGEHCILVPTVCRNVSRITKLTSSTDGAIDISPSAGRSFQSQAAPTGLSMNQQTIPPMVTWADLARPAPLQPQAHQQPMAWPHYDAAKIVFLPSPAPPINEPSIAAMLSIGLAVVFAATRRSIPRSSTPNR